MAHETITKRTKTTFRGISLRSKFKNLKNKFNGKPNNKIILERAKVTNTLAEIKEKDLAKFDEGYTAKVNVYIHKFY